MKPGSWLAVVVLAGVIGFLLGRGGPEAGSEVEIRREAGPVLRGGPPSKGGERSIRRAERSGRSFSVRGESAEAYVARMLGLQERIIDDPFAASNELEGVDFSRVTAAIFTLPEGSFPEVLEHCRRELDPDDPFGDPYTDGWDNEIFETMLARWTDLNATAAMDWLEAVAGQPNRPSMDYYKELVCAEAVRTDPDQAARFLEHLAAQQNTPAVLIDPEGFPMPDPFVDVPQQEGFFESFGSDDFFLLLCREHPERALELYAGASKAARYDGQEGWIQGMVDNGLFAVAMEYANGLEAEEREEIRYGLASRLGSIAPDRLEAMLEGYQGDNRSSLEHDVLRFKFKEDPGEATAWYLSQATDAEDRANRLAAVVSQQDSTEKAVAWVKQMEARGEDVGQAWAGVVRGAASEVAWPLLGQVPDSQHEEILVGLLEKSVEKKYVRIGPETGDLYEEKPEMRALAEAEGLGDRYGAYIEENNAKVAAKTLAFLQERGLVELEEE